MTDAVGPTTRPLRLLRRQVQSAARTTPGRFRLWSIGVAALLAVTTVAGAASAARLRASTRRVDAASGPVLVSIQQLIGSLAEADAAASAAFLSGRDEDPEQRRLYEQAMSRATEQVDDIASLAGDDQVIHDALTRVSVQLTQYAGLIEAARASNRSGTTDANAYLTRAVQVAADLVNGDLKTLSTDARGNLAHDEHARTEGLSLAIVLMVTALLVLLAAQAYLAWASRRIVNPGLALATLAVLASLVWLLVAAGRGGRALTSARRRGYDSIVLTTDLSSAGFGAKAEETLALITGDASHRRAADAEAQKVAIAPVTDAVTDTIRGGVAAGGPGGLLGASGTAADNPRERAAVAEAAARWQRYVGTVAAERQAPPAAAKAIAVGAANADFNGFNFSVESIVGQNRDQFLHGLTIATTDAARVPTAVLLLLLSAVAVSLWGFQLRINDYR